MTATAAPGRTRTPGQRVLTAVEIESEIMRLSGALDDDLSLLADQALDNAHKEHAYKVARAIRNLEAGTMPGNGRDGRTTVDERDAIVVRDTQDVWLESLVAEALWETTKERLHTMRDQIKALQTIAANIRAQS